MIAAEWIIAFRLAISVGHLAEIPRALIMVKNDFLIKFV
jgi:hypothetical protein